MQAKTFIALVATVAGVLSATTAMAGEATFEYPSATTSTLTRAEVLADAARARAAGQVDRGERSYVAAPTGTPKTRAQVVAETLEAIRIHALDRHEKNSFATAEQLDSIAMAGVRALHMTVASR